jgi:hypothetical protein
MNYVWSYIGLKTMNLVDVAFALREKNESAVNKNVYPSTVDAVPLDAALPCTHTQN